MCLSLVTPRVVETDLVLLLGRKVVLDVKELADLLGALLLDHVGDGAAGQVKQRLDFEIVGGEDELKEGGLLDLAELLVPGGDLSGVVSFLGAGCRVVVLVVLAVLDHLHEGLDLDAGDGDDSLSDLSKIFVCFVFSTSQQQHDARQDGLGVDWKRRGTKQ